MVRLPHTRLFIISAIALFAELALIRWLGSEVRIFAYFKNLILIACFVGFGLGFYYSDRRPKLGTSLFVLSLILLAVSVPLRFDWSWGPQSASKALSNFYGTIMMGDRPWEHYVTSGMFFVGLSWTLVLFMACLMVLFGYAQQIGRDIESFGPGRRLEAYSWNVAGSLTGILIFYLFSFLSLSPWFWFGSVYAASVAFLSSWSRRAVALLAMAVVCIMLYPNTDVVWSPYHKLEISDEETGRYVMVNGTGYMAIQPMKIARTEVAMTLASRNRWHMPYFIKPDARKVLIVGAGAGNDAAAAITNGVNKVVAVEIDPEIYRIGVNIHPDRPYDDDRIEVVIDDARHYAETTDEKFDLIIMSHLDSHIALSGYTNLRLDNYIYTVESLRTARKLLKPNGMLFLSYWVTQPWVATRLNENMRLAFDNNVYGYFDKTGGGVILAHYIATEDQSIGEIVRKNYKSNWVIPSEDLPPPSTDDWPYLYVEKHRIPTPMLVLAAPMAVIILFIVLLCLRNKDRSITGWQIDRHYFFLGAGFLLVEVHNVSKLARVFGTTWSVNAWVITGILVIILLANWLASRRPEWIGGPGLYGLLAATLLFNAVIPIGFLVTLPFGPFVTVASYTLPLFFASLIFAGSFRTTEKVSTALGSNLLGAILGGFLELFSFYGGLPSLLYIAVVLYLLSYPGYKTRVLQTVKAYS